MSLLVLNKVSYKYSGTTKFVLNNVEAKFDCGKIYTIVGKSGSGKTTLLSLISGLDVTTKGTIFFNDKDIKSIDRDDYRAKRIGVIFQGYNLLTNATAVENIVLSMQISGTAVSNKKQPAYELLTKVGIDHETANRPVLRLSGGEQQRVGIARALSHDPQIIIADEPTGNLDSETQDSIMEIFVNLAHNEGKCIIIVTHSLKVSSYADEVWGIRDGKLLFVK